MHRRVLSIALYFCATGLSFLFVAQLAGSFFPAFQIQYWPVALAGLFALAAFLLPEADSHDIPQGRFLLRCGGIILFLLSPFPAWDARLAAYGVGFAPIVRHIYLQMACVAELFMLPIFMLLYASAVRKLCHAELRFLGRKMLQAPLWLMIVPAIAVLAGIGLLMIQEGEAQVPLRMVPNVLWTILTHSPGTEICATLCCMALATQAIGVLCVICAKTQKESAPDFDQELPKCPEVLSQIAENTAPFKQEDNQNDQAD